MKLMELPSGREFDELDLEIIKLFAKHGFIRWSEKPFTLKSGVESYVYVFGREDLTDHPDLEWLVGRKIAQLVRTKSSALPNFRQPCLIGIPTAGTELAQAAAMVSYQEGIHAHPSHGNYPICHRIMREALKTHGAHPDWVNGTPSGQHIYWTVGNVVTDAGLKLENRQRLKESGYPVDEMPSFVLVDRQQGGIKVMEEAGFHHIVVAYLLLDLTHALGELDLWPKDAVQAVEEEIRAHQLI